MQSRAPDQLDKILALADSTHEGEAVGAVRMARQILSRDGLSFADLAKAATGKPRFGFSRAIFYGGQVNYEVQIAELQQQLSELSQLTETERELRELWRRRALEAEQALALSQSDAKRWKQLASETVEKLWDIGRELKSSEFVADTPASAVKEK
ncbi:MAG: hypothetical protein EBV03_09345 [Proteobacteria bacterium]|nr:hypothetical protein [Pseudomonadota bacterium]